MRVEDTGDTKCKDCRTRYPFAYDEARGTMWPVHDVGGWVLCRVCLFRWVVFIAQHV